MAKTIYFLTILEVGKSKIKAPSDALPGEGLFPGLQVAILSLYPHTAEREIILVCFLRALTPFVRTPSSWPKYFPKALPPDTIPLGIRISAYGFGGETQIYAITYSKVRINRTKFNTSIGCEWELERRESWEWCSKLAFGDCKVSQWKRGPGLRKVMGDGEFSLGHVELEVSERRLETSRRKSNLRIWNSGGASSP